MSSLGVCIRGCVYGGTTKPQKSFQLTEAQPQEPRPSAFFLNDSSNEVCMCVCMNEYECIECKEERRNQEHHNTHTHSYTPEEVF